MVSYLLSTWRSTFLSGVLGDLVYTKVFGQTILFVNSVEVAQDLLEKRSKIYSDRPDFPMLML